MKLVNKRGRSVSYPSAQSSYVLGRFDGRFQLDPVERLRFSETQGRRLLNVQWKLQEVWSLTRMLQSANRCAFLLYMAS